MVSAPAGAGVPEPENEAPSPLVGRNGSRSQEFAPVRWHAGQTHRVPNAPVNPAELAGRLFAIQRGLGWEYVPPPPLALPDDPEPIWQGQSKLTLAQLEHRDEVRNFRWYAAGVTTVSAGAVVLTNPVVSAGLFVVGMSVAAVRKVLLPWMRLRRAAAQRDSDFRHYEWLVGQWRIRRWHFQREQWAHHAAPHWFPLHPQTRPARMDVYGGTRAGWASLITTMGSTELRSGSRVLVIDFTEQHIGDQLAYVATIAGLPVSRAGLLQDSGAGTLLNGLSPRVAIEIVLEAVASERGPNEPADMRSVDAQNLRAVVNCLDGQVTFARLAAGLRVIRRLDPPDGVLSAREVSTLVGQIDTIDQTERVSTSLLVLTDKAELLAEQELADTEHPDPATRADSPSGAPAALSVLASTSPHLRRKDFLDRVLFQRLRYELRTRPRRAGWRDVVVVAGADHIGLAGLEGLARDAENAQVRLVLLLEHLRGDLTQLLGSASSHATILMKMSNPDEAKAAAEFIGREYSFHDSQVTEQVGESIADGFSQSWNTQSGVSTTTGTQDNKPKAAGWLDYKAGTKGTSEGVTQSRSDAYQWSVNSTMTDSTSTSTTKSRVQDLIVEALQIQHLASTGFILIETDPTGRPPVVDGDCNPNIVLLPRVAEYPRP